MNWKSVFRFAGRAMAWTVAAMWICIAPGAAAQQSAAQGTPATPAGNAQNGKKRYNAVGCWQCHGYSGQGGAGPKIAPNPTPWSAFANYTRTPNGQMPPYTEKVLPHSDLADIYAYMQSIPKPPDPKSIPLLNSD